MAVANVRIGFRPNCRLRGKKEARRAMNAEGDPAAAGRPQRFHNCYTQNLNCRAAFSSTGGPTDRSSSVGWK
jgi:hypothetical protein